jgi:nitrile hydratase
VRGKLGTIERDGGIEELQDTDTQGLGDKQQHVYTVRFTAQELWGEQASPHDSVYADLWEGYLESA